VYEILVRIFPTRKNISILDNSMKIINAVIVNKRKMSGNELHAGHDSKGNLLNKIYVKTDKHIISVFILMLLSLAAFSQSPITTQSRGLFLYNGSDTTTLKNTRTSLQSATGNTGGLFFDKTNNKWRVWDGTAWVNWNLFNSSGAATVTASNGLTKTLNNITLGGTLASNTTINGASNNLVFGHSGSRLFNYTVDASNLLQMSVSNGAFNIYNTSSTGAINIVAGGTTGSLNLSAPSSTVTSPIGYIQTNVLTAIKDQTAVGVNDDLAGTNNAYLSWTQDDVATEYLTFLIGTSSGIPAATFTDGRSFDPAGIEYAADYSATFTNRSLVDKAYTDTKIDGTMVANRVPYGVDANTLTTESVFTYNPTTDILTSTELTLIGLPASAGILYNNTVVDNEGAFTYNPTTNTGLLQDGTWQVTDTGTGSNVILRENGDARMDGNGDADFTTYSENAITTASGDNLTITATSATLNLVASTIQLNGSTIETSLSGTYTPTATGTANISSVTPASWSYMRVGSVVSMSGSITITPTAAASTLTSFRFSLPIASNFASQVGAGGTGATTAVSPGMFANCSPDSTNDQISVAFYSNSTSSQIWYFTVTYLII
jgi:hypothetical protein